MSRLVAAATGILTGLTAVLALATPAAAHARLLSSTPKDAGTVTKAVTEIKLRFSEPVKQRQTTVRVTGSDGVSYSDGDPKAVDDTVTQAVSALPSGAVKVGWRTVSVDGHTIQGSFTFTNKAPAPSPSASTAAPAATPEPTPATTSAAATIAAEKVSNTAGTTPVGVIVAVVVVALIAGAAGLLWWRRRRPSA